MSELSAALIDLVLDEVRDLFVRNREPRAIVVSEAGLDGHILLREVSTPSSGRIIPAIEIVLSHRDWATIEGDERFQAAGRELHELTREGRPALEVRRAATLWGVAIEIEARAMRREELHS